MSSSFCISIHIHSNIDIITLPLLICTISKDRRIWKKISKMVVSLQFPQLFHHQLNDWIVLVSSHLLAIDKNSQDPYYQMLQIHQFRELKRHYVYNNSHSNLITILTAFSLILFSLTFCMFCNFISLFIAVLDHFVLILSVLQITLLFKRLHLYTKCKITLKWSCNFHDVV